MSALEGARGALRSQLARAVEAKEKSDALFALLCAETAALAAKELRAPSFEEVLSSFEEACAVLSPAPPKPSLALAYKNAFFAPPDAPPLSEPIEKGLPDAPRVTFTDNRFVRRCFPLCPRGAVFTEEEDFESACEEVLDGGADCCLLPFLDGGGQPLPGVARTVYEYGLKKQTVFLPEGEDLRVGCALFTRRTVLTEDSSALELTVFPQGGNDLSELLSLAPTFGLASSLSPFPFPRSEEDGLPPACVMTFRGAAPDLVGFLFTAQLLQPTCAVSGLYGVVRA